MLRHPISEQLDRLNLEPLRKARIMSFIKRLEGDTIPLTTEVYWPVEVYGALSLRWTQLYSRNPFFFSDSSSIDKFFKLALPWIVDSSDPLPEYAVVAHVRRAPKDEEEETLPEGKTLVDMLDINFYDGASPIRITFKLGWAHDNTSELSSPHVSGLVESLPGDCLVGSVDYKFQPGPESLARMLSRWSGKPTSIDEVERKERELDRQFRLLMQGAFDELHGEAVRIGQQMAMRVDLTSKKTN